ncbi:uncharacterized protein [Dendrobates tinctorius]|uniref:uncharacterized protein n=2 Tax=Dendrobates tinctorius TaxID=92724 RepID=UPI003CC9B9FD
MEDNGPSTSGTSTAEYKNWTAVNLQTKARELGVSYKGLSKEQLIEALEAVHLQDDAEEGSSQQREERRQSEVNTQKSQWVVWYEEEMALLGEEATIEDKREVMRTAKERQRRMEERAMLEREITLEAARSSRQTVPTASPMRELPRVSRKDFKPFNEASGDIEGFFLDFEHQCRLMEVPERERVRHLVGLLEGGAAAAYRAMDPRLNCEYTEIKQTILEHYAVTPDTYRTQFRTLACDEEVSFKMYAHKLKHICHRWLEAEEAITWETFLQVILKEQFYFKCPAEIREWVRERRPATVEEAAALADEALTIKPQWKKLLLREKNTTSPPTLAAPGPSASNIHHPTRPSTHGDLRVTVPRITPAPPLGLRRGGRIPERRCYGCGQPGHMQFQCPGVRRQNTYRPPLPVHYLQTPSPGEEMDSVPEDLPSDSDILASLPGVYGVRAPATCSSDLQHKHLQEVVLDGQKVVGFRDTGAFLTIADPRVIQPEAIQKGPGIAIELAGGTQRYIPRASVTLDYGFGAKQCMVGVMSGLPADVLLGNDVGNLHCHFVGAVTRSQAKRAANVDVYNPSMEMRPPELPSQPHCGQASYRPDQENDAPAGDLDSSL